MIKLERGILVSRPCVIGSTNGIQAYYERLEEYKQKHPNKWLQLKLWREYRQRRAVKGENNDNI